MNHRRWIIVDKTGRRNKLGLMHGPRTGNVMVYYNGKVLIIDFLVFGSKTLSFFLDEELYELSIKQEGLGYAYAIRQNLEVDTPNNKAIKKEARNNKRFLVLFAVVFLLGFAAVMLWNKQYRNRLLLDKGVNTIAYFTVVERAVLKEVRFSFNLGYKKYLSPIKEYSLDEKSPNGFPYENGDELTIRYYPENPSLQKLDFFTINKRQAKKYLNRAMQVHGALNNHLDQGELLCELESAYQVKGVEGLSLFYNQQLSSEEDRRFNRDAFNRLTRDKPYRNQVKTCR